MEKKVLEVLKKADIPVFYVTRKNSSTFPCLVYTIKENSSGCSDDDEENTEYNIYINLYSTDNFIDLKNKIKTILKENGFMKKSIGIPVYDKELQIYEIVLVYSYGMELI